MKNKIAFGLLSFVLALFFVVASPIYVQAHEIAGVDRQEQTAPSFLHQVSDFFNSSWDWLSGQKAAVVTSVSSLNNSADNQTRASFLAMSGLNKELSNRIVDQAKSKVSLQGTNQAATQALQALILQKAKERKVAALDLMKRNPLLFLSQAMPAAKRGLLSAEAKSQIETEIVITGTVDVLHVDDFNNPQNSEFQYFLNTKDGRFNLYPVSDLNIRSGTSITAKAYVLDKSIVVDTNNNNVKVTSSKLKLSSIPNPVPDSVGNQRTLVLLIKEKPEDSELFTPAQAQDLVFNSQFQKFMQEQSYGKVSFSGDVFGWVSLGQAITSSCMFLQDDQLLNVVNTYKINLGNYDRIVYLLNGVSGGCSAVGKSLLTIANATYNISQASVGLYHFNSPSGWGAQNFTWTNLDYVLSHELGHSLGLMHSNGWYCTGNQILYNQILYGNCQHQEYGNPFDAMGSTGYSLDYNAYFKEQLGWIPKEQVLTISHAGSYSVNPLELKDGVKLAKVYIKDTTVNPYAIEFRKAIGFDSNLDKPAYSENQKGIFINRIQDGSAPATELLDMSPTPYSTEKITLNLPSANTSAYSFVDQGRGITVGPVTSVSDSKVSFQVDLQPPICQRFVPVAVLTDKSSIVQTDGIGYVDLNITNMDYYGCGPSDFDIVPVSLPSWQYTFYPETDLALVPSASRYKNLTFTLPATTSSGTYNLSIDVINKTSGLKKRIDVSITVTNPVVITNISPAAGPTGTDIVIQGKGFSDSGNIIQFAGSQGNVFINNIPMISSILKIKVPTTITSICSSYPCPDISTPAGLYTIYVSPNKSKSSQGMPFTVTSPNNIPSSVNVVTATSTPSLRLEYDDKGREAALVSNFTVDVKAGSEGHLIGKEGWFGVRAIDTTGNYAMSPISILYSKPTNVDEDANGMYVIHASSTVRFSVEARFPLKSMFAGTYRASLDGVSIQNSTATYGIFLKAPTNQTNAVTIIGEVSPYVNSISPTSVPSNRTVTISGVRFATLSNKISLMNRSSGLETISIASSSNNGQTIQFVPNVPAGDYYVSVTHPTTGRSNGALLTILNTPPLINSISPAYALPNQNVTISGAGFATSSNTVTLINQASLVKTTMIVDSLKDGQIIQFIPSVPPGTYMVSVTHPTAGQSKSIPLIISGTTTSITLVSPNGGETFTTGTDMKIAWKASTNAPTYTGFNLFQHGVQVRTIGNVLTSTGSYLWRIPADIKGTDYKIRIYGNGDYDDSDLPFSILSASSTTGFLAPVSKPSTSPAPTPTPTPTPTTTPVAVPAPTPTPAPTFSSQYLEAETGTIISPVTIGSDGSASGGKYVSTNTANTGSVSFTVITPAGSYYLWGRVLSPTSNNDSFSVSVDNGPADVWDTAEQLWSPNWQWTRVTSRGDNGGTASVRNEKGHTFDLTSGTHTFTFQGREVNTKLDKLFITANPQTIPASQTFSGSFPSFISEIINKSVSNVANTFKGLFF